MDHVDCWSPPYYKHDTTHLLNHAAILTYIYRKLTHPSPHRVIRAQRALRSHTYYRRPQSRSTRVARLMAASMAATQSVAQARFSGLTMPLRGSHAALFQVLGLAEPSPPTMVPDLEDTGPPTTVTEDYVSAFSFILNATDLAEDLHVGIYGF